MGIIQKKLEKVHFIPKVPPGEAIEDFLRKDLNKFIDDDETQEIDREKVFVDLPDEVIFKIFLLLDLKSLYNCSMVSRKFHDLTKDPLLYVEINLKFYWHRANSNLMQSLMERCQLIKKLDMSSCGYFNSIVEQDFIQFLTKNGKSLRNLRINSTQFLNTYCLQSVATQCDNLYELRVKNYATVSTDRIFSPLSFLTKLRILDLSQSGIDTFSMINLIGSNPYLTHLYLAFNQQLSIDSICTHVARSCKYLKVLDIWKCNMTITGLNALRSCEHLEELDLGWNLREDSNITESFKLLVQTCVRLRRLTLAAVRGISERELQHIATSCAALEYLDLMGLVGITGDSILKILQQCTRLKVLDLSFSESLDDDTLFKWAGEYSVSIKRS